jgi:integrase/recombinase XerD
MLAMSGPACGGPGAFRPPRGLMVGMIRPVIIPSVTAELEVIPGTLPAVDEDPIRRLVAAWLLGYESRATRRNYGLDLAAWLGFCGSIGLDPLTARRPHIDAWARTLQASGAAQRSVARRLAAVSSWYRYLVAEGIRADSPTEHVRRPKIADRGETPGLTRDELRRLLTVAQTHGSARTIALLTLLAHTGLRIGEALSRDVEHLGHDRGHRILRLERKGGRGDATVLTAPVTRALDAYLDGRNSGPIFITKASKRMGQPEAWKMVRRIARRASLDGADEIQPHSLRVAFITGAREAGVPLEDVQDAAGHADPRTTRRYDRGRHSLDRHASYAVTSWLADQENSV